MWPRLPWLGTGAVRLLLVYPCLQRARGSKHASVHSYIANLSLCWWGSKGALLTGNSVAISNKLVLTCSWLPVQLPGGKIMLVRRANTNYRRAQALGYDRRGSGELWPLDSHTGRHLLFAMDGRGSTGCRLLSSHVACCDAPVAGNAARPAGCTVVPGKAPTVGLQLASLAGLLPQGNGFAATG